MFTLRPVLLLALFVCVTLAVDPQCKRGVRNNFSTVCCARSCRQCFQNNCTNRGKRSDCCPQTIKANRKLCTSSEAPCVLALSATPSTAPKPSKRPDPNCNRGKLNALKNICCLKSCGSCGFKLCKPSSKSPCCVRDIRIAGKSCDKYGPPCIIASKSPLPTPSSSPNRPDPSCLRGKLNFIRDACCPLSCPSCNSTACRFSLNCCPRAIRNAAVSCTVRGAPCIPALAAPSKSNSPSPIPSKSTSSPDPNCSRGKLNFKKTACCPRFCSSCGYSACTSNGGPCCVATILKSNVSCRVRGPPCIPVPASPVASPSNTPSSTPVPSRVPPPDSQCRSGKLNFNRNACCPSFCQNCGSTSCSESSPECCPFRIRQSGVLCSVRGPPCVPVFPSSSSSPVPSLSQSSVPSSSSAPSLSSSPIPSSTSTPSVSKLPASPPDPLCSRGKLNFNRNACCPSSCRFCGPASCPNSGGECCPALINDSGISCADQGPPCIPVTPSSSPSLEILPSSSASPAPPSQSSVPFPFISSGPPDPDCNRGKLNFNRNACCPASCRFCGPGSCPESDGECCPIVIRNSRISCASQGPPCIPVTPSASLIPATVESSPTPSESSVASTPSVASGTPAGTSVSPSGSAAGPAVGDPFCETGIINRGVCCDTACGTCGGSDCAKRGPGRKACCIRAIREEGTSCEVALPPCVLEAI